MNATAPASICQASDDGVQQSVHREAKSPTFYVYFLVGSANSDLAGLFKLGITNHLPTRYRCHTSNWKEFDLSRSTVLVADKEWKVRYLEKLLKDRFAKWQRYPGRDAAGHTEFFSMDGWTEIIAFAQDEGERVLDARLIRGIDPAECATSSKAGAMSALNRKRLGELSAEQFARKRQAKAEWGGHITLELEVVLSIARNYEEYLVWVDLAHWYELLTHGAEARRADKGLLDLYFGGFPPEPSDEEREEEAARRERRFTQARFADWVGLLQETAVSKHTSPLSKYRPKAMFYLREPLVDPGDRLPDPLCAGTLLLRVQCARFIPRQPFLAEFETMVRRIESRRSFEQLAFSL